MKIYLLILAIVILSHSKYRNLRNLTLYASASPRIICISPNEFVYEYQTNILTYNITNSKVLQNITLTQQSPIQLLPQHSALIYINNSNIYQIHSNAEDQKYTNNISNTSWPSKISSFNNKFISAIYDKPGSPKQFTVYGPKPWDVQTVAWDGLEGETITGGSEPNMVGDNQFYFASGGTCDGNTGQIYFQKGTIGLIENIYNFTLDSCKFGENNRDWSLQTYQLNDTNYHLLTYVSYQDSPFRHTSQLVSSKNGNFTDVAHFSTDRLIGVSLASQKVIYTADNLLCRVVEHDIQNHEHEHMQSAFATQPDTMFVTPSQNLLVTTGNITFNQFKGATVYKVDQNLTISKLGTYFLGSSNVVRAQILTQTYLFYFDDSANNFLSLQNINDKSRKYNTNLFGIVDFCVANQDKVFVLHQSNGQQVLGVYSMVNDIFTTDSSVSLTGLSFQTITCLDNNYVLLNPTAGKEMKIYQYPTSIVNTSSIVKDALIHAKLTYANDILIFTNSNSNQSVFYDYNFTLINITFNLPPNSNYQIIQSRRGELVIAVGNDIGTYSSLQYYKNQNSIFVYKGSFPFLDDGTADIPKTILFPSKGRLHIEYQSQTGEWSTYFDLASPPLRSIGYFYDTKYNDCSFFDNAVFRITSTVKELLLLNNNNDYPILQKYSITDKLTKTQFYPLNKYLTTKMGLQLTNKNEIIIRGIYLNRTFNFQVRNLDLLSTIIYSNVQLESIDGVDLQTVEYVNQVMISLFSTNKSTYQTLNLVFTASTQQTIALQTSIFSAITTLAACSKCSKIAFTGTLTNITAPPTALVGDYTDPTIYDTVVLGCPAILLALSPSGQKIAWSCANSTIFAYDIKLNTSLNLTYVNYTTVSSLSFVDQYSLLGTFDQAVQKVSINIFNASPSVSNQGVRVGTNSSYAIDYTNQIYAIATSVSTIQIYNFNDVLVQTFTINNTIDISSLSFNSNGDLYVANIAGNIFAITSAPCSFDRQLIGDYCICKQLYNQNGSQCVCKYRSASDGTCICNDQYYVNGDSCSSCSAMCSTCNSGDSFDCIDFSAGFYILIVGLSLLLAGALILLIFKLKKKKEEKEDSLFTQQRTKLGQKSTPSLKEQIMIRSSFQ